MSFETILEEIHQKQQKLSLIRSPTGSGKSTRIVSIFAERGLSCFLVCPTIPAAKNLYQYMSQTIESIGYAADSEIKYYNPLLNTIRNYSSLTSKNTEVVYCTTGHMKNIIYDCFSYFQNQEDPKNLNFKFCDYIILDEIHIGSIDITMIYRLWMVMKITFFQRFNIEIPSLILTSATYIDTTIPMYTIEDISKWNVDIYYLTTPLPTQKDIFFEIIAFLNSDLLPNDSGIWLVFLPGIQEIEMVKEYIESSNKYEICIAHSSLSSEELEQIFIPPRNRERRKLILATNIAETSLTIDNLSLVIDSMLEKIPEISASGSLGLKCTRISKDSAQQRKGRIGRTCNGKLYRMCTPEEFENLEESRSLEIHRLPIINDAIRCISSRIELRDIFYDLSVGKISECFSSLREAGAIDNNELVTELGDFVTKIPASFKTAVFLYRWIEKYPIYPGIILSLLIEMSDTFFGVIPFEIQSHVPFETLLNIWVFAVRECPKNPSYRHIDDYTRRYKIKLQSFYDLKKRVMELSNVLGRLGKKVTIIEFDPLEIYKLAHPILCKIYPIYIRSGKSYIKKNDSNVKKTKFQLDLRFCEIKPSDQVVGVYTKKFGTSEKIALFFPYHEDFNY
jgi:HrpA-like RNA helicase